jgi:hypothetical protein
MGSIYHPIIRARFEKRIIIDAELFPKRARHSTANFFRSSLALTRLYIPNLAIDLPDVSLFFH